MFIQSIFFRKFSSSSGRARGVPSLKQPSESYSTGKKSRKSEQLIQHSRSDEWQATLCKARVVRIEDWVPDWHSSKWSVGTKELLRHPGSSLLLELRPLPPPCPQYFYHDHYRYYYHYCWCAYRNKKIGWGGGDKTTIICWGNGKVSQDFVSL